MNVSTGTLGDANPAVGAFPANHGFYVAEFIDVAAPELIYDMFGTKRSIPKGMSNSITYNRVEKLGTLEATALTEGVTPTEQQFEINRINATLSQYGGFATTTDRLTDESINGLTSEFNTRIAEQGGETMNKVTRNSLSGSSNVRYKSAAANRDAITASGLDIADLEFIYLAFRNEKVKAMRPGTGGSVNVGTTPTKEQYPWIVANDAITLVEALTLFTAVEDYSSQRTTWMNEYGSVKNFAVILDTEAEIVSNGAVTPQDINKSLIFGKDAYDVVTIANSDVEIIIKPLGSSGTADPLNQRSTIGWKAKKIAVVKQPLYMYRYEFSIGNT
jgi:N4-gp56 family major capsid protein